MVDLPPLLDGYQFEGDFAVENHIERRTSARYRHEPDGMPFVEFGGKIYIHIEGAKKWLLRRQKRPNPRRRFSNKEATA
jgi:hypothetical protein